MTMNELTSLSIGDVERATGISRESLRKWETRYGFPVPGRDAMGERTFTQNEISRLRLIKSLMNLGLRPSAVVPLSEIDLRELLRCRQGPEPTEHSIVVDAVLQALKANDPVALAAIFQQSLTRQGLGDFVATTVADLNIAVGDAWQRGELSVFQEHMYTEELRRFVMVALEVVKPTSFKQSVLLATPSGEQHSLGLLMVQCLMTLAGYRCHYLGTQMPVGEIVAAASAFQVDVVALSLSITFSKKNASSVVEEVRAGLPGNVVVWVGGAGAKSARKRTPGVKFFDSIGHLRSEIQKR